MKLSQAGWLVWLACLAGRLVWLAGLCGWRAGLHGWLFCVAGWLWGWWLGGLAAGWPAQLADYWRMWLELIICVDWLHVSAGGFVVDAGDRSTGAGYLFRLFACICFRPCGLGDLARQQSDCA